MKYSRSLMGKLNLLFCLLLLFLYAVLLLLRFYIVGSMTLTEFLDILLAGMLSAVLPLLLFNMFYEYLTRDYFAKELSTRIAETIVMNRSVIDTFGADVKRNFLKLSAESLLGDEEGNVLYSSMIEPYLDYEYSFREDFKYYITYDSIREDLRFGKVVFPGSDYYWETQDLSYSERLNTRTRRMEVVQVGFTFEEKTLNEWFSNPDIIFREMIWIAPEAKSIIKDFSASELDQFVYEFMGLSLEINDQPTTFEPEAVSDGSGFLLKVSLPPPNSSNEYRFALSFSLPHRKTCNQFIVGISEPTHSVQIQFKYYGECMRKVETIPFFNDQTGRYLRRLKGDTIRIDIPEWVLPRSGVVFTWENTEQPERVMGTGPTVRT